MSVSDQTTCSGTSGTRSRLLCAAAKPSDGQKPGRVPTGVGNVGVKGAINGLPFSCVGFLGLTAWHGVRERTEDSASYFDRKVVACTKALVRR